MARERQQATELTPEITFGRTPWFGPDTKPVRRGVYQRRSPEGGYCFYSYWNGKEWGLYEFSAARAARYMDSPSAFQHTEWRGLTQPAYEALAPHA
jgi:hypothetical protein